MGRISINYKALMRDFDSSQIMMWNPSHDSIFIECDPELEYFVSTNDKGSKWQWDTMHALLDRMCYLENHGYKVEAVRFQRVGQKLPAHLEEVDCAIPHPTKNFWVLCNQQREVMFLIPDEELLGVMYAGVKIHGLETIR